MSLNPNVTNPDNKKRILLVAANPSTSATIGWPIGPTQWVPASRG